MTMDRYEQDFAIFKVLITIAIAGIIIVVAYTAVKNAFGDDNENDLGLCLNYHVKKACARVDANKNAMHDLEGKLFIWNTLNCSVRDICNPLPNVTNGGCDPNDEAYNLTGHCDYDWNDTGVEDPCFATKGLADRYMNFTHTDNASGDIHYPCPDFKMPKSEDESGK